MVFLVAVIKLVSGLFVCLYSTSEFALRCSFLLVVPVQINLFTAPSAWYLSKQYILYSYFCTATFERNMKLRRPSGCERMLKFMWRQILKAVSLRWADIIFEMCKYRIFFCNWCLMSCDRLLHSVLKINSFLPWSIYGK